MEISCVSFPKLNSCAIDIFDMERNQAKMNRISVFDGEYEFLSNLYTCDIKYGKLIFNSAEHLYQTVKFGSVEDRLKIRNAETPRKAKVLGQFLKSKKPHWDTVKTQAMVKVQRLKFAQNYRLKRLLKNTDNRPIISTNHYHDTFWGVCGCTKHKSEGLNMLGKILMKIRDESKLRTLTDTEVEVRLLRQGNF